MRVSSSNKGISSKGIIILRKGVFTNLQKKHGQEVTSIISNSNSVRGYSNKGAKDKFFAFAFSKLYNNFVQDPAEKMFKKFLDQKKVKYAHVTHLNIFDKARIDFYGYPSLADIEAKAALDALEGKFKKHSPRKRFERGRRFIAEAVKPFL